MSPTRRQALALLAAGAGTALLGGSCARDHRRVPAGPPPNAASPRIDATFAEAALRHVARKSDELKRLRTHRALGVLLRHQRMSGNPRPDADALLRRILAEPGDTEGATDVLTTWRGREKELRSNSAAAERLLPASAPSLESLGGVIYFVVGYDIGVAAPPDVVINVAHRHFAAHPGEVGPYITHEAHHVGFLSIRGAPSLDGIDDPARLLALIRFFTHLEGMGVHAAYAARRAAGTLGLEPDYAVYADEKLARRTCERYREVLQDASSPAPLAPPVVGRILDAMSSGERLWYRVGALAAREIERQRGRASLAATVEAPGTFHRAVEALVRDST